MDYVRGLVDGLDIGISVARNLGSGRVARDLERRRLAVGPHPLLHPATRRRKGAAARGRPRRKE